MVVTRVMVFSRVIVLAQEVLKSEEVQKTLVSSRNVLDGKFLSKKFDPDFLEFLRILLDFPSEMFLIS